MAIVHYLSTTWTHALHTCICSYITPTKIAYFATANKVVNVTNICYTVREVQVVGWWTNTQNIWLFILALVKCTLSVLLTFLKVKNVHREVSILFFLGLISFFLLSFSIMHNSKTIQCMWMLYIANDPWRTGHLSFLAGGIYTQVLPTTGKLQPQNAPPCMQNILIWTLLWLLFTYSGHEMYIKAIPEQEQICYRLWRVTSNNCVKEKFNH